MRQPRIRLNLVFSVCAQHKLLYLFPILCLGNVSAKFAVSAFGSTVFRQVNFGGKSYFI